MEKFIGIVNKKERLIIGVMSGTSLDGIDLALVRFKGSGPTVGIELLAFQSSPMPPVWRKRIQNAFTARTEEICRINYDIGHLFAQTIQRFCLEHQIPPDQLDAIGFHGQTLYHVHNHSTLQTGEAEILAQTLKCLVVSDFRSADIAAGGSGAPLVPYLDQVLYREHDQNIALLNLGGIGNITYLPKNSNQAVQAFDTGPANAILNETVEILTEGKHSYDKDGSFSRQGSVNQTILTRLLQQDYFKAKPPKSTGREEFGQAYVNSVRLQFPEIPLRDLLRTFVSVITNSVYQACHDNFNNLDLLYVSGGGAHHPLIMEELQTLFGNTKVCHLKPTSGISVDSKEAVAFALLAHERLNNHPTNIPSVTGAKYLTTLGKLTIPFQ